MDKEFKQIIILEDSRQQYGKHDLKHKWFRENGIQINRSALVCGDYQLPSDGSVAVDSKSGLAEVIGDIQVKQMSKSSIKDEIIRLGNTYNVSEYDSENIFHLITDDDANRFPESQITDYCFKQNIPDECMKKYLDLYTKRHGFFHRGLVRAKQYGVKLFILVEEEKINSIRDVFKWTNPRLLIYQNSNEIIGRYPNGRPRYKKVQKYPQAMRGAVLAKAMITIQERYGCKFVFTSKANAGAKIVELLTKK